LRNRFLAAFIVAVILGVTLLGINTFLRQYPNVLYQLATPPARGGYAIKWSGPSTLPVLLTVNWDGSNCVFLEASTFLRTTCELATHLDPAYIGGQAFGRLNNAATPAGEALIWRAVVDGDVSDCERGGLLEAHLAICAQAVQAGVRAIDDQGYSVLVEHNPSA
jgi:hypothetical protein